MMLWLLLSSLVWAGTSGVVTETRAQVRHDLFGERLAPVHQYVTLGSHAHGVEVGGFGALQGVVGLEQPMDPDIYHLWARGRTAGGRWVVGRQPAMTLFRPQTVDGGRYDWEVSPSTRLEIWGGVARHQDLNDLLDGVPIARGTVQTQGERWWLRVGSQAEGGMKSPFVARQDVEGRVTLGPAGRATQLRGVVGVAAPDFTWEWGRLEARTPTFRRLDATLHVERREAARPEALFGDAVLYELAGGTATQAAGITLRTHGARWAVLSAGYRLTATDDGEGNLRLGHAVDVHYVPARSARVWRLHPAYSVRTGVGGTYHALTAVGSTSLGDRIVFRGRAGVVPYRKGAEGWRLALDSGLTTELAVSEHVDAGLSMDFGRGVVHRADLRTGVMVRARFP